MFCFFCKRIPLSEECLCRSSSCITIGCPFSPSERSVKGFCSLCYHKSNCELQISLYMSTSLWKWQKEQDAKLKSKLELHLPSDLIGILFSYLRYAEGILNTFVVSGIPYNPMRGKYLIQRPWLETKCAFLMQRLIDLQMFALEPPLVTLGIQNKCLILELAFY